MRIAVIGCGYLGAVHAACMTKIGHDVTGLDTDQEKAERLARGEAPFHEPGFPELLAQGVASGRLTFTTDPERIAGAELVFIGVGTPQLPGRLGADLSQVDAAVDTIIRYVVPRPGSAALVAGKSTVPVGTAQRVAEQLAGSGRDLLLAWNPEFLREGHAVTDTLRPDRIVYGLPRDRATGERAKALLDECYAPMLAAGTPLVVADYPTAELVKVAANAFLATKISFINAMAELCDATGGDVTRLAEAIGHDDRIGPKFLQAGIGFGGGCLPKDLRAFMARAGELGVDQALTFLREVDAINQRRRDHAVTLTAGRRGTAGRTEGDGARHHLQTGHRRPARLPRPRHHLAAVGARRRGPGRGPCCRSRATAAPAGDAGLRHRRGGGGGGGRGPAAHPLAGVPFPGPGKAERNRRLPCHHRRA